MGVGYIRVDRCAIALDFPVGRDLYVVPIRGIVLGFIKIDGPVTGLLDPVKLPLSIERLVERRGRPFLECIGRPSV